MKSVLQTNIEEVEIYSLVLRTRCFRMLRALVASHDPRTVKAFVAERSDAFGRHSSTCALISAVNLCSPVTPNICAWHGRINDAGVVYAPHRDAP